MKKIVSLLLIGAIMAAMLTVYAYDAGSGHGAGEAKVFLSLCDSQPETSLIGQAEQQFGEYLQKASNGRIELRYYPSAALGDDISCIQQVQWGALDLYRCDVDRLHDWGVEIQRLLTDGSGIVNISRLAGDPILFSEPNWKKLTAEDQEIITVCWEQAAKWYDEQSKVLASG